MTEHAFLEPECSIGVPASYDHEHPKLTVYVGSQILATGIGLPRV